MTESTRLPVYRNGCVVGWSLVDPADYDRLKGFRYYRSRAYGHAYRVMPGLGINALARDVVGLRAGEGRVVHHINEDKLDNRRANLEVFESQSAHQFAPHPKGAASRIEKCREAWQRRQAEEMSALKALVRAELRQGANA